MQKRKVGKKRAGRSGRANGEGSLWTDPKTGLLYAKVTWTVVDPLTGKKKIKPKTRRAKNATHGYELIRQMKAEYKLGGEAAVEGGRVTLAQLAEIYKREDLIPEIRNSEGTRVAGIKSWKNRRACIDTAVAYFGATKLITMLTTKDVRRFKAARLATPLRDGFWTGKGESRTFSSRVRIDKKTGAPAERSVSSVHKELGALRCMLNSAIEKGWLSHNVAARKKDLINPAEEKHKELIALPVDEEALLAACDTHKQRRHLKPYLITAIDSGARSIELRRLLVRDLDFDDVDGRFMVYSDKGKLRHFREIIMTPRMREALLACCEGKEPGDPVFSYGKPKEVDGRKVWRPIKNAPKGSFDSAKREAKFATDSEVDLDGFTGHDLRHTFITRAIESGAPLAEVGKYAGHRRPETTWRYLNPSDASRRRIASLIANYKPAAVAEVVPIDRAERKSNAA